MAILKMILFIVFILSAWLSAADWPCAGGNIARTNVSAETGILPDSSRDPSHGLKMHWRRRTLGTGFMEPIIADNKAYINDQEGHITCLDLANGDLIWRYYETQSGIMATNKGGSMCYHHGRIYMNTWNTMNPTLICMDANTGEKKWEQPDWTTRNHYYSPIGYRGRIYGCGVKYHNSVTYYDVTLWARDTADGSIVWSKQLMGYKNCSPPVIDSVNNVLFFSVGCDSDSGKTLAYCLNGDSILWENSALYSWGYWYSLTYYHDTLFLADWGNYRKNTLFIDARNGNLLHTSTDMQGHSTTIAPGYFIQAWYSNTFSVFTRDGISVVSGNSALPKITSPSGCGQAIYCNGYVYRGGGIRKTDQLGSYISATCLTRLLDNPDGAVDFRFQAGTNFCSSPAIGGGKLVAYSADGWVYCFGN
jgi:outer membrane protein assembly factor BamB